MYEEFKVGTRIIISLSGGLGEKLMLSGEIISDIAYSPGVKMVRLDENYLGRNEYSISCAIMTLEKQIPNEDISIQLMKEEILEIITANKPAEQILLDLEDYITN